MAAGHAATGGAFSPVIMRPSFLLLALAFAGCDRAADAGREGNAHLDAGRPADALAAYGRGLARVDPARHDLTARLLGNSALAQMARDSSLAALTAADLAAASAEDATLRRNALYHGGIAAAAAQASDDALARFRAALRLDGAFEDAAYNWEAVSRARPTGGGGGDTPRNADPNEDPSAGKDGEGDEPPPEKPDPEANEGGRRPGDDPNDRAEPGKDATAPPPRISESEAERLLDAAGRDEARLMRRTVRGTHGGARPTRDW